MNYSEFDEIRPYGPGEVWPAVKSLLNDRQFMTMLRGFVPLPKWMLKAVLRVGFIGVKTPLDFQKRYMKHVVRLVLKKCSDGCTFGGHPMPAYTQHHTFVSNHRDIVLDSAILDLKLFEENYDNTVEIAIGDNLLIYPWIRTLVKLNKAFTVKRGLSPRQLMESSMLMSRYIHHAVTEKGENIWIAQREGRAKDSNDRTQDSVLKMLSLGGDLSELNIVPLTISYEYDPCDYLKAQELQMKRDNPAFKKSKKDDLDNMKTGILGYKGRIHYECAPCINEWLPELSELPKKEYFAAMAERMDRDIHKGYMLFPGNYIALDRLNGNKDHKEQYTDADIKKFDEYINGQLDKIRIPVSETSPNGPDREFLLQTMLTMYANPVRNKVKSEK